MNRLSNVGQFLALFLASLMLVSSMPAAQDAPQSQRVTKDNIPHDGAPQVTITMHRVLNTPIATLENDKGSARFWIVKDPASADVVASALKDQKWHELTELGNKPWGTPANLATIRKDPKVREYIKTMTTLTAPQQAALNHGLDSGEWLTLKAKDLPILHSFWGYQWQHYKVSMNLEPKFQETEVYAYFGVETNDWFLFYSYCRNLAQPFSGFEWEAHVELPRPPAQEVVPPVKAPWCVSLKSIDGQSGPLVGDQERKYECQFENPNGVAVNISFVAINKVTKERRLLSSGSSPRITIIANWFTPGKYQLVVFANYDGKNVDTSPCVADFEILPKKLAPVCPTCAAQNSTFRVDKKHGLTINVSDFVPRGTNIKAIKWTVDGNVAGHDSKIQVPFADLQNKKEIQFTLEVVDENGCIITCEGRIKSPSGKWWIAIVVIVAGAVAAGVLLTRGDKQVVKTPTPACGSGLGPNQAPISGSGCR